MKIAVLFSLLVLLFISAELCSARRRRRNRRTNINWGGINHRSRNGRHNTNVNYKGVNYNYGGRRWNTNANYNFRTKNANVNANYRRNHNFNIGYNARNKQTNAGYRWNFGRRRRDAELDDQEDYFKQENDPKVFLTKLTLLVTKFVQDHYRTVPELKTLSVSPVTKLTTNVTVAKEVVCLIRTFQAILPNRLGNFTVKMIKFHGPSFNIETLEDFYEVKPIKKSNGDNQESCVVPEIQIDQEPKEIKSVELLEIKKFVASLIKVAMQYQQLLEN